MIDSCARLDVHILILGHFSMGSRLKLQSDLGCVDWDCQNLRSVLDGFLVCVFESVQVVAHRCCVLKTIGSLDVGG